MKELVKEYKAYVEFKISEAKQVKLKDVEKHFMSLGYSKEEIHKAMNDFYKEEHSNDDGFIP